MVVQRARKSFETGKTKPLEYRIHQLERLFLFISKRGKDIADALKRDLGKVDGSELQEVDLEHPEMCFERIRYWAVSLYKVNIPLGNRWDFAAKEPGHTLKLVTP